MRERRTAAWLLTTAACVLSACRGTPHSCPPAGDPPPLQRCEATAIRMGVPWRIVIYAREPQLALGAARTAFERVSELTRVLDDRDGNSDLNALTRRSPGEAAAVSPDLFAVLEEAKRMSRETGGAFDITVGPVVKLWRRAGRIGRLPRRRRLRDALDRVGSEALELDPTNRGVRLTRSGVLLDAGGIGKGYAAQVALDLLTELGFPRALVDAGGDICAGDSPPGEQGWRVGVSPLPDRGDVQPERLLLARAALATSGDRSRAIEIDGVRYSHIVDPRTGLGITGRQSVSVVVPADAVPGRNAGAVADALASAFNVLELAEVSAVVSRMPGVAARVVRVRAGEVRELRSPAWAGTPPPEARDAEPRRP